MIHMWQPQTYLYIYVYKNTDTQTHTGANVHTRFLSTHNALGRYALSVSILLLLYKIRAYVEKMPFCLIFNKYMNLSSELQ